MSDKNDVMHPEGIFNPLLRFAFTNITEELFVSAWDGQPIKVPAGTTIELPHHLAVKMTKELVDKIMIGNAKLNEVEFYKNNPNTIANTYRSASSLGVPAARKVWEDQICRQMEVDEESPQVQVMRATIREELMKDLSAEPSSGTPLQGAPSGIGEFADLTKKSETVIKADLKVKTVKDPDAVKWSTFLAEQRKLGKSFAEAGELWRNRAK